MTEPAHYSHGPSGAARWLICTDSPFAQEGYPDDTTDAADEGTAAHWLLEQCLNAGQDCQVYVDDHQLEVIPAGTGADPENDDPGTLKDWPITGEMIESVQLHIDTVMPDAKKKGTRMFVEERVRLDEYMDLPHPVGGTADTILYLPRSKVLKVVDFKYGRGHVVEVDDDEWKVNPQLGIYALAAMAELERLLGEKREVKWIELCIVQPRAPHKKGKVRTKKIAPFQLMKLEGAVIRALTGPRVRVPGDHCFFCRAKPDCEAFHADRQAKATADFSAEGDGPGAEDGTWSEGHEERGVPATVPEPNGLNLQQVMGEPPKGLTLQTLGYIRQHLPDLRNWIKEVEEEIKVRLLHDLKVPGARLGTGRGKREYGGSPDEIAKATIATAEQLDLEYQDLHTQPALKSPAALEKELGKDKFKATPLAKLVTYEAGGPMVVDEDSDTPDWTPANKFEAEAEVAPKEEKPAKHHLL